MEEEQKGNKKPKTFLVLKIVSILLLIGSVTMITLSFTLGKEMGDNFGLRMGGFLCLPISVFLLFLAFLPNIQKTMIKTSKYVISNSKTDLEEISRQSGEISSLGAKEVAKSITQIVTEQQKVAQADKIFCKHCGQAIDSDSKFCSHCGKEQ